MPQQPDLSRLLSQLNQTDLQQKSPPLFQVISQLIKNLKSIQDFLSTQISGPSGPVSNIANQNFLTSADNTPTLPNSRQLLAGTGITFNDVTPGQRTISSSASSELPVGTIYSTWINSNPGGLLGYGVWTLFAIGEGSVGTDITFTVQ